MPLLSEAALLAALKAAGSEEFDTGNAARLVGTFDDDYREASPGIFVVAGGTKTLRCRKSDVTEHRLVKGSPIIRVEDGARYFVKELQPDSAGLVTVVLRL